MAEQILFDLWRADFPNTTIDEVVMNIDEGQKNRGTNGEVSPGSFSDGQSMTGGVSISTLKNAAGKRDGK